ncbi:MAG: PTS fructose transporter subunit IIC [Halapricum sp.]
MSTTTDTGDMRSRLTSVKEDVMTGVSFMIPFVTIGGIFLALGYATARFPGMGTGVRGVFDATGTLPWFLAQMGVGGLTIMVPILGAYIAYAIADRPGLAPGFMLSWIIQQGAVVQQSGQVLGLDAGQAGAGYLGALVAGLLAGYVARWFKQRDVPGAIKPMMPVLIIPVATVAVLLPVVLFVIGVPVAIGNSMLTTALKDWAGSGAGVIVGIVLGLMMAFDMGGPVNKVAYVFSVGLVSQGVYGPMAAVMIAGMTPPIGMALSTFFARHKYPDEMYEQAKSSIVLGFSFITEGAIPYAAADPFRVIPSLMVGSAVAAGTSMGLGLGIAAPHGGVFVIPLARGMGPLMSPLAFLGCIALGSIVTAVVVTLLKPDHVPESEATGETATAD